MLKSRSSQSRFTARCSAHISYNNLLLLILFGSLTGVWSSSAQAIPVTLNWQTVARPGGIAGMKLEVAADKGFSEVVFTGGADRNGIQSFEVPREGVYHWRMLRPSKPGDTAEQSSHMSGTFAAFESSATAGGESARLTWQVAEGADRYKLVVYSGGKKTRELTTTDLNYVVAREADASTIEVVPYWHLRRASRTFHYDPSLALENALVARADGPSLAVEPLAPTEPVASTELGNEVASEAPSEAPSETETDPEPEKTVENSAATETGEAQPKAVEPSQGEPPQSNSRVEFIPGLRRLHHVQVAAGYGSEKFHTQKLEAGLHADIKAPFVGGGFWTNPAGGFVVDVRGDYHEIKSKLQDDSAPELDGAFGDFNRTRFTFGLNAGYDFLRLFDSAKQHQFSVEFASALIQMPLLDVEQDVTLKSSEYVWHTRRPTFVGAGVTYSYFWQGGAMTLFGRGYQNASRDFNTQASTMNWYGATCEFYPSSNLSMSLTGQMRQTLISRCSNAAGNCLAQGKVRTQSDEVMIMLGVGAVRF